MFQLREPFFFFWPHHAICRISIPRPEIKPSPGSESVESIFFFLIKPAWASLSIPCICKSPYCFLIPERLQGPGIPKMSQSIPDKHKVWVSSKLMEAWAALTKDHSLCVLGNKNVPSPSSGAEFPNQCVVKFVSPEGCEGESILVADRGGSPWFLVFSGKRGLSLACM